MASPTTISSEKLEKILEVNSKAIEINTIVSGQYERVTEHLENMKRSEDVWEKEMDVVVDIMKEQHKIIISSNQELKKNSDDLLSAMKSMKEMVEKIDRTLFRISVVLVSSTAIVTAIVNIIAKLVFKV